MAPIDLRAAVDLAPRRQQAQRLAVSRLEKWLVSPLHAWAIRSVYRARLEAQGIREEPPVDCWIVRS